MTAVHRCREDGADASQMRTPSRKNGAFNSCRSCYYRVNETSGTTATDSSANAHTGTLQGGATHVAGSLAPSSNPALQRDGTGDHVSTPTQVGSPEVFSLEMWFKTTTTTGGKPIGFGNAQTETSSQIAAHHNAGR